VKRVCAWCGKPYGEPESGGTTADLVTHGICDECERVVVASKSGLLTDFLDGYSEPILCVDQDCRVMAANQAACSALGHDRTSIGDLLFGQVVLCPWALRDGGCGSHEHCLACTVRRLVGDTAACEPGEGVPGAWAYVEQTCSDGTVRQTRLMVSSERRDGVVFVRIDEIEDVT
jgi:hypothetical protein